MTFVPDSPELQKNTTATRATREAQREKRTIGEDAVPAPSHSHTHIPQDVRTINGWGADLDPKNRPSVPRELPSDVRTVRGDVKHWQTPHMKIYQSNEQPGITPVFGETIAPAGLSGMLRDYAFQFGEATSRHWMTLLLADRINVWEHLIGDAMRGRPDNYVREKGWSAKIKYGESPNRALMIGGIAVAAIGVAFLLKNALDRD